MSGNPPEGYDALETWFTTLSPDLNQSGTHDRASTHNQDSDTTDSTTAENNSAAPKEAQRPALLLTIERPAMACNFEVLLNQLQYSSGTQHAMDALDIVSARENSLSIYRPLSDLSNLNRLGSQRAVGISHETFQMLSLSKDLYSLTEATFDITAGALSQVWGFARREGKIPSPDELRTALELVGDPLVELDAATQTASLKREGVLVNPGGIGKGLALDHAAQCLLSNDVEDFMIHGGLSSIVARGTRQNAALSHGWGVALKHPLRFEETLGTIELSNEALGTSGSGKQFFHFQGKRYSHIIDPRTGWPAEHMLSATVICPSGAIADALATALFVMGREKAHEFCEQHPQIDAILVYRDSKSGRQKIDLCNGAKDRFKQQTS